MEALKILAVNHGFYPLAAKSATDALRQLKTCQEISNWPIFAIIDRDLSFAYDQSHSSDEVLIFLYNSFKDCQVMVYSANLNTQRARQEITRLHPQALIHDKEENDELLFDRIERIVSPPLGDLLIDRGAIVHNGGPDCKACEGKRHGGAGQVNHRVARRLVMAHPNFVEFRNDSQTRAARRFRDWLVRHNSNVECLSLGGDRRYRLHLKEG